MKILCVLKTGGEYKPSHVLRLRKLCQLFTQRWERNNAPVEFRCLTDSDDPSLCDIAIPLHHDWPGWWSKLELFRPPVLLPAVLLDLGESALYFDLDTEIIGDISPLIDYVEHYPVNNTVMALNDFYREGSVKLAMQSSVLAWRRGSFSDKIYSEFEACPDEWIAKLGNRGDQGFLEEMVYAKRIQFVPFQKIFPGFFCSYKVDCGPGVPRAAHVVIFHGKPRPWEVAPVWSRLSWT